MSVSYECNILMWCDGLTQDMASALLRFILYHTQRRTTVGMAPLDERSARRRDLYLHNTQQLQETGINNSGGIWTRNPSKREAAETHLRPRGHWGRLVQCIFLYKNKLQYYFAFVAQEGTCFGLFHVSHCCRG